MSYTERENYSANRFFEKHLDIDAATTTGDITTIPVRESEQGEVWEITGIMRATIEALGGKEASAIEDGQKVTGFTIPASALPKLQESITTYRQAKINNEKEGIFI